VQSQSHSVKDYRLRISPSRPYSHACRFRFPGLPSPPWGPGWPTPGVHYSRRCMVSLIPVRLSATFTGPCSPKLSQVFRLIALALAARSLSVVPPTCPTRFDLSARRGRNFSCRPICNFLGLLSPWDCYLPSPRLWPISQDSVFVGLGWPGSWCLGFFRWWPIPCHRPPYIQIV